MTRSGLALRAWAILALFTQAQGVLAQDAALTTLDTGYAARGWEAVGRLDIADKGFCTGTLIAPDLVLTAAHCLFERDSDVPIDPARIEFLAGFRNGRALAYRDVRRAVAHPDYQSGDQAIASRNDVALLELSQPVRLTGVRPFDIGQPVVAGAQVGVVSYAHDRPEAPALQEICAVLGEEAGVMVMSCEIDFGSSGAPVFAIANGIASIVSVVSAKAEMDGSDVALGAALGIGPSGQIETLITALAGRGAVFRNPAPGQVRIVAPGERVETGARFVRP